MWSLRAISLAMVVQFAFGTNISQSAEVVGQTKSTRVEFHEPRNPAHIKHHAINGHGDLDEWHSGTNSESAFINTHGYLDTGPIRTTYLEETEEVKNQNAELMKKTKSIVRQELNRQHNGTHSISQATSSHGNLGEDAVQMIDLEETDTTAKASCPWGKQKKEWAKTMYHPAEARRMQDEVPFELDDDATMTFIKDGGRRYTMAEWGNRFGQRWPPEGRGVYPFRLEILACVEGNGMRQAPMYHRSGGVALFRACTYVWITVAMITAITSSQWPHAK